MQHTVTVRPLKHRGGDQLGLFFKYDHTLKEIAKGIGCTFSYSHRCWYFPDKPENLKKLLSAFDGKAKLDVAGVVAMPAGDREKLERFRIFLQNRRYSPRTIGTYLSMVATFRRFFNDRPDESITNDDIEDFNDRYIIRKGFSNSFQRQMVSAIKLYFGLLEHRALDLDSLVYVRKNQKLPVVLSMNEVNRLLGALSNLKHKAILAVLYSTGMRISELCNLRLTDIDSERMVVTIRMGKGARDRSVPLSDVLLYMLRQYARLYKPVNYLFTGQYGGPYSAESVRSFIGRAALAAGIRKHVTPHTLRHTFATHHIEAGTNLRYVQDFMGHRSPKTTMTYTHINSDAARKIMNPLDRLFLDSMEKTEIKPISPGQNIGLSRLLGSDNKQSSDL